MTTSWCRLSSCSPWQWRTKIGPEFDGAKGEYGEGCEAVFGVAGNECKCVLVGKERGAMVGRSRETSLGRAMADFACPEVLGWGIPGDSYQTSSTVDLRRAERYFPMLRHAESDGATVFEETKVTEVQFEGGNPNNRAISATWLSKKGQTGTISFDHIIDASGRNGIICTKYLKNRTYNEDLRNVAVWGYWKNPRPNSPARNLHPSRQVLQRWSPLSTLASSSLTSIPLFHSQFVESDEVGKTTEEEGPRRGGNPPRSTSPMPAWVFV